jgi:hypothetical protein
MLQSVRLEMIDTERKCLAMKKNSERRAAYHKARRVCRLIKIVRIAGALIQDSIPEGLA